MKLTVIGCVVSLALPTGAFAATTPVTPPPTAPAPAQTEPAKTEPAPPAPTATPAPASSGNLLEAFINDLAATAKLTDEEKKDIQAAYQADGVLLHNILNNDAKSPLQQAQEVADLRATRNTKIEALLQDGDRKQAFQEVEAKYRVALTELAADGGLVPPPAPAPAAPTPAPAAAPAPAPASPPAK